MVSFCLLWNLTPTSRYNKQGMGYKKGAAMIQKSQLVGTVYKKKPPSDLQLWTFMNVLSTEIFKHVNISGSNSGGKK